MNPIRLSEDVILNPEIPADEEEYVFLCGESAIVNIYNLTLPECQELFAALDPVVTQVAASHTGQAVRFRGTTRKINFSVDFYGGDPDQIGVTGRDVENETDNGDYCHDFEIDAITVEDWNLLKAAVGA